MSTATVTTEEQATIEKWRFQSERCLLLPYVESNAAHQAIPETVLATIYKKTKDQGLLEVVFPSMERPTTLNRFIAYMFGKPIVLCFLKDKNGKTGDVVAYAWVFEVAGNSDRRKAFIGFCYFKEVWGRPEVKELARIGFRWWFEELNVKVLYGTILWRNKLAVRFARELGFVSMGRAPYFFWNGEEFHDAHILYLTDEAFHQSEEVA